MVHTMPKEERINFRLGPDLLRAIRSYAARYERSESDVIREAVWAYLEAKGHGPGKQKGGKRRR